MDAFSTSTPMRPVPYLDARIAAWQDYSISRFHYFEYYKELVSLSTWHVSWTLHSTEQSLRAPKICYSLISDIILYYYTVVNNNNHDNRKYKHARTLCPKYTHGTHHQLVSAYCEFISIRESRDKLMWEKSRQMRIEERSDHKMRKHINRYWKKKRIVMTQRESTQGNRIRREGALIYPMNTVQLEENKGYRNKDDKYFNPKRKNKIAWLIVNKKNSAYFHHISICCIHNLQFIYLGLMQNLL